MSEPVQLAKLAREQLAKALNALQTSDVPDDLVDAAEPVAQAMGVLHRIERTNGANLEGRDSALDAVRSALGRVQLVESSHPAVEQVMEAIAASLSKVHALARYQPPAPPAPAPAPAPAPVTAPLPMYEPAPKPVVSPQPVYAAPVQPVYAAPAPAAYAPPPQPVHAPPVQPVAQPAPKPVVAASPMVATVASPQRAQQPVTRPTPVQTPAVQASPKAPAQPVASPAARPIPADRPSQSGGGGPIDVVLGSLSTSNFYKGLGGNDVIEHGGIFVATYKVLKINTPVTLRVLLPGDYEFTASAVVQWTREGGSSEPGYGARFTQISQEGRQLVYRYARNREPMFYDDL